METIEVHKMVDETYKVKLSKLFENQDIINNVTKLLKQGKAGFVFQENKYDLILGIWSDIPETITRKQLKQLLELGGVQAEISEHAITRFPTDIKTVIAEKSRILNIINNNRTYNKSLYLHVYSFSEWVIHQNPSHSNDFEE